MDFTRLSNAIDFAARVHQNQTRKGPNPGPYIYHPIFVAMCLVHYQYDEDVVIAGLLHDTVEDGGVAPDDIEQQFGQRVRQLVEAVTEVKDPSMSREEKQRTWLTRKERFLEKLKDASVGARAISAFDLLHNALELTALISSEGASASQHFNAPLDRKIWFARQEIELFRSDAGKPHATIVADLLERLLAELEKLP